MNRKIKSNELPARLTPEGMRKEQAAKDKVILSWAAARGCGTKPPTFPEISTAPVKSEKNIKRAA